MTPQAPVKAISRLVLQRIRNRVIEYLELAASFEAQREYQARAPVSVPNEVINMWEDWVPGGSESFVDPVFTPAEREAMGAFTRIWWEVAESTPDPLPELAAVQCLTAWTRLRDGANAALQVFRQRGRLSDDVEI